MPCCAVLLSADAYGAELQRSPDVLSYRLLVQLKQGTPVSQVVDECGAASSARNKHRRVYLTCAVRLSPEKEPGVFIALAAHLHASGALARHSLTPLLLASARSPYADELRATFRAQVPTGVVHEAFLGPQELAAVFAQTRLNVHPCQYDAYGMTVIEAASQGAPSVVHQVCSSLQQCMCAEDSASPMRKLCNICYGASLVLRRHSRHTYSLKCNFFVCV